MKTLNGFCNYVPSGKAVVNGDTSTVQSFYMSAGEITNIQYNEFLFDLKRNGELAKLKIASIDTVNWINKSGYGASYADYYHRHPAYEDYPVVNVTKEGAELFCSWLSKKYEELSNGELKITFRIPTHAEWMRAARGSNHYATYTWGGPYLRGSKGNLLANFMAFGSENITQNPNNGKLEVVNVPNLSRYGDNADVTAPVLSYYPNEFGMYNMNGNVAEMVSDGAIAVGGGWRSPGYDIRNESSVAFNEPDPTVGFRVVATYSSTKK